MAAHLDAWKARARKSKAGPGAALGPKIAQHIDTELHGCHEVAGETQFVHEEDNKLKRPLHARSDAHC